MHRNFQLGILALSTHAVTVSAARDGHCPPLGAVLPVPTKPSADPAVQSAVSAFKAIMDELAQSAVLNTSAMAIGVKSIHEETPLLEWTFTPPEEYRDPRGVQQVDFDTVFRIASLSKVFPVLGVLLQNGVSIEDPVTKYVPELRALNEQARAQTPIWTTDWDSVTIGSLMSHTAGIAVDMPTDIAEHADLSDYGFPPLNESRLMNCSGLLNTPECDRQVFFARFGERAPVELPFSANPVYSNIAFALLGFVVEAVTNKPFSEYLHDEIFTPAGMTHSFAEKPDDSLGFIPPNDEWWNATLGFGAPAGAYYSSINDLLNFGTSILQNKFLSQPKTRKWFKPSVSTSSSGTLIGQPWEIFRVKNVTSDRRLIELYTKGGDIKTYHSLLAFIPDYDIVVAILLGGANTGAFDVLGPFSQMIKTLLPGIEAAGKTQASSAYAGTYTEKESNSTITLALDESSGLDITNWVVRGVDVRTTAQGLDLPPLPYPPPPLPEPARFRLYPSIPSSPAQSDVKGNQTAWRAVPALGTAEEVAGLEAGFVWEMAACVTWASLDRLTYMLQSWDHFVFGLEGDNGRAKEVELAGYGVTLVREDE
ncbi:beta-lactamase/transpeptidase-like protein [Rhypophila decipiens]|uniref:Beta-lactamase/transpeptidase-like protein n=1 Tax=Rhypophila decipiens TaxID=261697 RepID=A0AAN6XX16_9PEZI|nr:beta-lactamase/transpeptidase-like protein [Rhypophila decipiens]